jgi:pyridoxine 5'-phosphate synthase PdxJ
MRSAIIGLALGLLLGWLANGWRLGEQVAEIRADHAEVVAAEQQRARQIESGWYAGMLEVQRNAQEKLDSVAADVAAASSAAERLRERVSELSRRPAACPGAAGGGETAYPAGLVLSDVLSRIDQRASELAEAYDRARIAGLACEAAHDLLSGG